MHRRRGGRSALAALLAIAACGDGERTEGSGVFGDASVGAATSAGQDDGDVDTDATGSTVDGGGPDPTTAAPTTDPGDGDDDSGDAADGSGSTTGTGDRVDGPGFSVDYPGDVGIEGHPSVLFYEDFEDPDIATLTAGWDNATTPEALSLSADVPAGAVAGSQSLTMSNAGGGVTLYESLPNQQGDVYVRYYARYNLDSAYHHTGMWIGGYNPPTPWPQGTAGVMPTGTNFFHNTFEPAGGNGGLDFDHYAAWPGMGCLSAPDQCWGNHLLAGEHHPVPADTWVCLELKMGLNTPGRADGSFAIWMNDALVQQVEPGTPLTHNGVGGWTPDAAGDPFPGFDWRSTPELGVNWIWLDFYTDGPSAMDWDQVVAATERIGCMAPA